jgi:hypothetical protein
MMQTHHDLTSGVRISSDAALPFRFGGRIVASAMLMGDGDRTRREGLFWSRPCPARIRSLLRGPFTFQGR